MAFPSSQNKELSVLQYSPLIWVYRCDTGGKLGGHSTVTQASKGLIVLYSPHALEQHLAHKHGLRHSHVHTDHLWPVIPTPAELEVTQVVGKPAGKPVTKIAEPGITRCTKKNEPPTDHEHHQFWKLGVRKANYQPAINMYHRTWKLL